MNKWLGFPFTEEFQGLNLYNLTLNTAYVIANTSLENAFVYTVNEYCHECPFKLMKHLQRGVKSSWIVDTSETVTWRIMNNGDFDVYPRSRKQGIICEMRPNFNEYGVYKLDVGRCQIKSLTPTYNTYLPLALFTSILLSCLALYAFIKFALRCRIFRNNDETELNSSARDANGTTLLFFRGLVLMLLIFVTTGGGGYPIFTRKYGGLSAADCLFFSYAWSIGVYIPNVINQAMDKGRRRISIFGDIFVRSLMLVLLGVTIDSTLSQFPNGSVAIWRPLEMIGVAYLTVGSAYLVSVQRIETKNEGILLEALSNLLSLLWCWIISGFILATIIILIAVLGSYNCIIKTIASGSDYAYAVAERSVYCNNDLTMTVNLIFAAEKKNTIFVDGYYGFSGGLLGTLSTVLATMVGLKAGVVYGHKGHANRAALWGLWGGVFAIGATLFAVMSIPVNCNLWPITSVLLITAASHLVLTTVYALTEVSSYTSYVTNTLGEWSLPILTGHVLFSNSLPFHWPVKLNNHSLYLLQNLWIIFLWVIISVFLKKSKVKLCI